MGRKLKYKDEYHKKKREGMRRLRRKQRIHRFSRYAGDRDGLSASDIDFMDNLTQSSKELRKVRKAYREVFGDGKFYTPFQASQKFKIELSVIYNAIKSGKLESQKRGWRIFIPENAVEEFKTRGRNENRNRYTGH